MGAVFVLPSNVRRSDRNVSKTPVLLISGRLKQRHRRLGKTRSHLQGRADLQEPPTLPENLRVCGAGILSKEIEAQPKDSIAGVQLAYIDGCHSAACSRKIPYPWAASTRSRSNASGKPASCRSRTRSSQRRE
jgi:hypothetical protein